MPSKIFHEKSVFSSTQQLYEVVTIILRTQEKKKKEQKLRDVKCLPEVT